MDILYHLWDFSFLGLFYKQENIGSKDERSAIWPTEICYFLKKEREIGQIQEVYVLWKEKMGLTVRCLTTIGERYDIKN